MKKLEKILVMLMVTGFVMRLLKIAEGGIIEVITGCTLSFFYVACTFFLLNSISFKKTNEHKRLNAKPADVLKSIIAGIVLSYTVLALVFKTMAWPGGQEMIETALGLLIVITVIAIVGYSRNKKDSDRQLLVRCVIYTVVSLLTWFVPVQSFILSRR